MLPEVCTGKEWGRGTEANETCERLKPRRGTRKFQASGPSLQRLGRKCPQVEGERYFSGFLLFTLEQMGLGGRCYLARNIQEYSL